jgi:heme exporter protein B
LNVINPKTNARMLDGIWSVLEKDLSLELRSRFGVNSVLAFIVAGTLVSIYLIGTDRLESLTTISIYWILIVFAAITAMNRAFVIETDRSTMELLQLHASPMAVYVGKLLYNFLFTFSVSVVTALIFNFLIGFAPLHYGYALLVITLGSLGMAGAATLLSALVAQTDKKATLFPVVALPVLMPLMLLLSSASRLLIEQPMWDSIANDIMALVGYCGTMISASILLFEYLWDA